jgi:hypothetical protein
MSRDQKKGLALKDTMPFKISDMTLKNAELLCKEQPEVAAKVLMAIASQNTAELPDTTFVRREDGAYLKKVRSTVMLTESSGEIIRLPTGNKYTLSIEGYRRLNALNSVMIVRPEHVIVDGQKQMNPLIQVNQKTRMPEVVYARCFAVGYSPTGSLVATDVMIRLDINIYLLENIQAKIKRAGTPEAADLIGMYGASDDEDVPKGYKFFPIHSTGGIGLWVNTKSKVIHEVMRDHTTRLKFIERLAQSFAERNALKAHPSIPSTIQAENGRAMVTVTGWVNDFDRDDIRKLQDLAQNDRLEDFRDGVIDVTATAVVTSIDEEDVEVINQVADDDRAEQNRQEGDDDEEQGQAEQEEAEVKADMLPVAAKAYADLRDLVGIAKANAVKAGCGIENLEEATAEELKDFITKANQTEG